MRPADSQLDWVFLVRVYSIFHVLSVENNVKTRRKYVSQGGMAGVMVILSQWAVRADAAT